MLRLLRLLSSPRGHCNGYIQPAIAMVVVVMTALPALSAAQLTGTVHDQDGTPLPGATVVVLDSSRIVTGTSTDAGGRFCLKLSADPGLSWRLRVSCVGYIDSTRSIEGSTEADLSFGLQPAVIEIDSIKVRPLPEPVLGARTLEKEAIARQAMRSLVPTNPTAALKQTEISRVGSAHSSQLRVHGTNPVYYLNGLPIGTDPAHYGMFSVIPAPAIERVSFYAHGTDANHGLPSTVGFATPTPFGEGGGGEVVASTIDATGSYHYGAENYFILATVRKSILDRLVNQFDISTERRTLPPTNFQDVFISAGYRLDDHIRLMVDQYHVRDFLSYNSSGATGGASDIATSQKSRESFVGVRANVLYGDVLLKAQAAIQDGARYYRACPDGEVAPYALCLDLTEASEIGYLNLEATYAADSSQVTIGMQAANTLGQQVDLEQQNWNFLPPFANTDNPFVYQEVLNDAYGELHVDTRGYEASAFISHQQHLGKLDVTTGLRLDRYSLLADKDTWRVRARARYTFDDQSHLGLFAGTFSTSPVANILEPYQAIIRAQLYRLSPVSTRLFSASYSRGPVTVTLFDKYLSNLATVSPDFSVEPYKGRAYAERFVSVESSGEAVFRGVSVSYDKRRLLDGKLDIYASYAYTDAYRVDNNVTLDYELHAPHRLAGEIRYRMNRRVTFGSEIQARSGYPYSPLRTGTIRNTERAYTQDYYRSTLELENSLRFPLHAYVNVSATYAFSNAELFFSISNLTNRANPIVSSGSGLIYDAGIMPMIGVRLQW
ncbi:hypothetical protein GF377_10395 [candidate division GN15 bacterium]|nr:hypothetical protein [candidate division GN15 bacterium]